MPAINPVIKTSVIKYRIALILNRRTDSSFVFSTSSKTGRISWYNINDIIAAIHVSNIASVINCIMSCVFAPPNTLRKPISLSL